MELKDTRSKGAFGEEVARNYLLKKGYKIIFSNFEINKKGEIDIIAIKDNSIYFAEVKYRKSDKYGDPLEAIGSYKLNRIYKAIDYYLHQNPQYKSYSPVILCIGILKVGYNGYKVTEITI